MQPPGLPGPDTGTDLAYLFVSRSNKHSVRWTAATAPDHHAVAPVAAPICPLHFLLHHLEIAAVPPSLPPGWAPAHGVHGQAAGARPGNGAHVSHQPDRRGAGGGMGQVWH